MEKYIKINDLKELLNRLSAEPAYQHEDEDFYSGVCAVECALDSIPTIEFEPHKHAYWQLKDKGVFGADYICSHCGCWAPESNSGRCDALTSFCSTCGSFMVQQ